MFSYISEGEVGDFKSLSPGVYEGKIVKIDDGTAKSSGNPMLTVHIKVLSSEGSSVYRYYLTSKKEVIWKIDAFIKNVLGKTFREGEQVLINPADFTGKTCFVRIGFDDRALDQRYTKCMDVLDREAALAIIESQKRVEPCRAPAQYPARPEGLPGNNHMSATAGLPLEQDNIPF